MTLQFQPSLFDASVAEAPAFDPSYTGLERIALDERSWADYVPGWVRGSDELFQQILASRKWGQRSRWLYEKKMLEPRLTAPWNLRSVKPLQPAFLEDLRVALSVRYAVKFDSSRQDRGSASHSGTG